MLLANGMVMMAYLSAVAHVSDKGIRERLTGWAEVRHFVEVCLDVLMVGLATASAMRLCVKQVSRFGGKSCRVGVAAFVVAGD